jgi:hypothetical protein
MREDSRKGKGCGSRFRVDAGFLFLSGQIRFYLLYLIPLLLCWNTAHERCLFSLLLPLRIYSMLCCASEYRYRYHAAVPVITQQSASGNRAVLLRYSTQCWYRSQPCR